MPQDYAVNLSRPKVEIVAELVATVERERSCWFTVRSPKGRRILKAVQLALPDGFHGSRIQRGDETTLIVTEGELPAKGIWTYAGGPANG